VTTGSVDPATGLANLAVPEELRRAAGRLLVALAPAQDLLLRAKHLFVAAIDGWSSPGACAEPIAAWTRAAFNTWFPRSAIAGDLRRCLQETDDGALDTGLGLHSVDVAAEEERDDARR
jgi:hypothetical protein